MARRGNREGSVYYDSHNKKWIARFLVEGKDGSRKYRKRGFKTKREARAALRDMQASVPVANVGTTVSKLASMWITTKSGLGPTTLDSYQGKIRKYINPAIGMLDASKVKPYHLVSILKSMEGMSASTIRHTITVLRGMFSMGVELECCVYNPAEKIQRPRLQRNEPGYLSLDEVNAFLKAATGDRLEHLYTVAIFTGARLGELMGVRWTDVDLNRGTMSICRKVVDVNGKFYIEDTKTKSGRRMVTLPDPAVQALLGQREKLKGQGLADCELIFPDTIGGFLRRQNIARRSFNPIAKRAGIKKITFHGLRHTQVFLLMSANVPLKVIQERLGHSSIQVTSDIYGHVNEGMQRIASDALNNLLKDEDE